MTTEREVSPVAEPGRRLLGGRYELGTLLATGGQGQVWRARDTLLSRPVAVKVLRSEFTGDPTFLARFRAEAQHAALVAHRHIAALHDYGELDDGVPGERLAFLVMELVEGESLADLLAREVRLDAPRTLAVLRQAADALAAAHAAGLVHRDVKPGNVLVAPDGTVKITDFGIAVSASSVPLTQTGQVVGTAHYLSPEQAAGNRAGPASDVYALGLIGYECLAGRRAFDGESAVQIALSQLRDVPEPLPDDVPEQVRTLIEQAMVKDPARRLPDGAAFRAAIDDVLAGRPLPPHPVDTSPLPLDRPEARAPRRARLLAPLAALLVGAGGAGLAVLQLSGNAVPPAAAETTEAPGTVLLVAADHLGRPVADVEAELGRLGLRVETVADPEAGGAAGTVTGLTPTGALERGSLVTLSYAVGQSGTPTSVANDVVRGSGTGRAPDPDPAPAFAPGPPPAPAPVLEGSEPEEPELEQPGPVVVLPASPPTGGRTPVVDPPGQGTGAGEPAGNGGTGPPVGPGANNGRGNGAGPGNGPAGPGRGNG